jgi:hypothetical protein
MSFERVFVSTRSIVYFIHPQKKSGQVNFQLNIRFA